MLNEANVPGRIHLDREEIMIVMLTIYGFSETDMQNVTGIKVRAVKTIREILRLKLRGFNSSNMGFHGQKAGFHINGTFKGQDIFTDEQKKKILLIDDTIEFYFPPIVKSLIY